MLFLIVLTVATLLVAAGDRARRRFVPRRAARLGMGAAMIAAGVAHLLLPLPFEQHLPLWVPEREVLVAVSGIVEIALGAALWSRPPWRRRAGAALAGYLILVFPANAYVAATGVDVDGQPGGVYPWVRLPLQALFIAWALWCTREADEPVTDRGGASGLHDAVAG
ncbi:hypothetical protein [Nocardioides sp.]|uniref:DoxX family protein n=1 Tax=Nocardioides sp. TaxID=35761 RepID=UPI002ED83F12